MAGNHQQTTNGRHAGSTDESPEGMIEQLTSPTALRKLVLNYLVHHCYLDTAQAFADDGISTSYLSASATHSSDYNTSSTATAHSAPASSHVRHLSSSRRSNGNLAHGRTPSSSSRQHGGNGSQNPQTASAAHPLSAPPLSRQDSSMEVEADALLSLASASASSGDRDSANGAAAIAPTNGQTDMKTSGVAGKSSDDALAAAADGRSRGGNEELSVEDLQHVRIRRDVRDHIVAGRIRQAIELCNRYFPQVLNASEANSSSSSSREHQGHASSSKHGKSSSGATLSGMRASATNPSSTTHDATATDGGEYERILPDNPTSLDPSHLLLNLQIQAFIEIVRTASSSTSSTTASATSPTIAAAAAVAPSTFQGASAMPSMHSIVQNTPGIAAAAISRSASPAPSSTSSTGSATSGNAMSGSAYSGVGGGGGGGSSTLVNPALHAALRHAQNLYNDVQSLPAYWRAMYLKELESVTTMLAYTDLEGSPVGKYLDQNRRVALAEQINSAIMLRTGKPPQPLIESAVRQTTFCWSTLAKEKISVPSSHALFSSGTLVGVDAFENAPDGGGGTSGSGISTALAAAAAAAAKGKGKLLPSWTLNDFLRER